MSKSLGVRSVGERENHIVSGRCTAQRLDLTWHKLTWLELNWLDLTWVDNALPHLTATNHELFCAAKQEITLLRVEERGCDMSIIASSSGSNSCNSSTVVVASSSSNAVLQSTERVKPDYLFSANSFWYLSFCWQAYIEALYHAEKGEWDYRRMTHDWWETLLVDVSTIQTIALILSLLLYNLNIPLICIYRHLQPGISTRWWNAIQCQSTPVVYHSRVLSYLLHVMVSMVWQRDVAKVRWLATSSDDWIVSQIIQHLMMSFTSSPCYVCANRICSTLRVTCQALIARQTNPAQSTLTQVHLCTCNMPL